MRAFLLALLSLPALQSQEAARRPFKIEELKTPPGFEVSIFAGINGGPRLMTFGPNGVLYVAVRGAGTIVAVPQQNKTVQVAGGLRGPHSLQFRGQDLYVSVDAGIVLFRNAVTDDLVIRSQRETVFTYSSVGGGHTSRTLGIGPDDKLYFSAGSSCNFCLERDSRRATMTRMEIDGSADEIYARGLRNSVGFAWHPLSGDLWATDNGGDDLGDNEPPDEVNNIRQGGDYGWPDCIGQSRPANWGPQARTGRCGDTLGPLLELQAHSAPLGISFYTGAQFPASYQYDAFISFHGSWNRTEPTGYKVVRVRASKGRAAPVQDFLWGFLDSSTRTESGRPVHALAGPDGSLYVSDDQTGYIYRVAYTGPRINPDGIVNVGPGIYSLYGQNLVNDPSQFSLYANGVLVQPLYAGSDQVNFVLPDGLSGDVSISVKNEKASDDAIVHVSN